MTAAELRAWRAAYMLSRIQLADLLGVDRKTVLRWENGESRVPLWLPLALETLAGQRKQLVAQLRKRRERLRLERGRRKGMRVAL